MSEFDEYQADAALRECLPQLLPVNAEIRECCTPAFMRVQQSRLTGARLSEACLKR
jgi:hypothetical protein